MKRALYLASVCLAIGALAIGASATARASGHVATSVAPQAAVVYPTAPAAVVVPLAVVPQAVVVPHVCAVQTAATRRCVARQRLFPALSVQRVFTRVRR